MYAFAQRKDTTVVDEPLYAAYLETTNAQHPGREEILDEQSADPIEVLEEVLLSDHYESDLVFFKQMTHHWVALNLKEDYLKKCENIIFIRDPRLIIRSYSKVMESVSMEAIGIKDQLELFQQCKNAIVLDSKDLLTDPEAMLQKLCEALEIKFDSSMLQWKPGKRIEDGCWAKYWYDGVHQSTGFKTYKEEDFKLSQEHEELAEQCLPYYKTLLEYKL